MNWRRTWKGRVKIDNEQTRNRIGGVECNLLLNKTACVSVLLQKLTRAKSSLLGRYAA